MSLFRLFLMSISFCLGLVGTANANLLSNGDFSAGNVGFTTDYTYGLWG